MRAVLWAASAACGTYAVVVLANDLLLPLYLGKPVPHPAWSASTVAALGALGCFLWREWRG